jgi:photosystem II stability/assembly factor-like uncharacterized protein
MSNVKLSASHWTPIGPAPIETAGGLGPISGRIQASASDPTDPAVLFVGADNGGVWKNTSAPGWVPLTDFMPSLNFGGYHPLAVHPANHHLIVGLVSGTGAGILKSTDGGTTWQLLANSQFDGQGLNSIAVHPTDTNTMYLSASWFGAWKSNNGGTTWQRLNNLPSGSVTDIILAKFDSSTLYAGVVGNTGAQQAQNGIYRSTDGGATWHLLSGGLPPGSALAGGSSNPPAIRLESGTGSGVVYVSMLTVGPNASPPPALVINAIQRFKTLDGGTTWTALAASGGSLENRSWHLLIAVLPGDDNHIFANDSYSLYESTDGGSTWTQADAGIGYLSSINHFDWVNMAFGANGDAVPTADQGVLRYNPTTKAWTSLIHNLQVSEFYTITPDPHNREVAYAVGQDIFAEKFTGPIQWNVMEGSISETGRVLIDPHNTSQLCAFNPLDTNNFVRQSADAGATWTTIFPPALLSASFLNIYQQSQGYNFAYLSQKAFAMDPSNPARILMGADRVFQTTNAGSASPTWTDISNVLSTDPTRPFVLAIAIASSDSDTVYAATQDGHLWVTYDRGVTWKEYDNGIFGSVVDLRIDPQDENHVFAITGGRVWQLTPAGLPWLDITGDLPGNLGLNTIFVDWRCALPALYIGTSRGVYQSLNLGKSWTNFLRGMPNTSVNDLQGAFTKHHGREELALAAGTFGRGAWEIVLHPWAAVATAIADNGDFGDTCLGSFADELLTINNTGCAPLLISAITSSSADFEAPSVASYPLVVSGGDSMDVMIRFEPLSFGSKSATITIFSNDPRGPHTLKVSGTCPAPRLSLMIANKGNFGKACVGSFVDEPLILANSGKCTLSITVITSSSADFIPPEVLSYPFTIGPGDSLPAPIRFQPSGFGPKSATITVVSNDPASPATINVTGNAPSGTLAVTGSTTFGGVTAGCCADRTLSICNIGDCDLHVASVGFKRPSRHWTLLHNPFPAALHPGSCLGVVIRYHATERCARCCELVIETDDPVTPVQTLDVLAYTIWDDGGCKEPCDDCRKDNCDKCHPHGACRQGYPCCCEDDEDES